MANEIDETTQSTQSNLDSAGPGRACLVVIFGASIGKWFPLDAGPVTIGRSPSCTLIVPENSVSREHARIVFDGQTAFLEDLGSRNGTKLNRDRVQRSALQNGDLIQIGATILKYLSGSSIETQYHEEIYRLATIDPLTGVQNRRSFADMLEREVSRATRHKTQIGLALIDVDNFKQVNDTHGHPIGDDVLRELAWRLRSSIRREDFLARYGGEEFVLILPDTDAAGARSVCEKLRKIVAEEAIVIGKLALKVTISIGFVAIEGGPDATSAKLLAAVDAKLYEAKAGGRNVVFG